MSRVDLVIVGAGGHGREIADIAAASGGWERIGLADDHPDKRGLVESRGLTFLGSVDEAVRPGDAVVVGIGDPSVRAAMAARLDGLGVEWVTLVHPSATIGSVCTLGRGVVLFPGARATTNVTLGDHVHLDTNSSVSHDSTVGAASAISPGAVVAGACSIGVRVLVGAGAVLRQGVAIGDGAVIGAGAVVVADVTAGLTVAGVPARPLRGH